MKRMLSSTCLATMILMFVSFGNTKAYSEEKIVSIPLSVSYSSVYWWRGVKLDGPGYGVFWPGTGLEIGDFALSIAAGIPEDLLTVEASEEKDAAKSYTEVDYGISYSTGIDMLSIGIGVMYVSYPFYDEVDSSATDPSLIETSLSLGLDTFLAPALGIYYDYFLEETDAETPVSEDYYISFSIGHDLISTEDGFICSLGASVGYYNNAYFDLKGFSDAVITAGISKDYEAVSFSSSFNYARTLGKDFQEANGDIKNNFWADFGVSTAL